MCFGQSVSQLNKLNFQVLSNEVKKFLTCAIHILKIQVGGLIGSVVAVKVGRDARIDYIDGSGEDPLSQEGSAKPDDHVNSQHDNRLFDSDFNEGKYMKLHGKCPLVWQTLFFLLCLLNSQFFHSYLKQKTESGIQQMKAQSGAPP